MKNNKIIDLDKNLFETILPSAKNYREALTKLNISYCSGTIARVRAAAKLYNIDISHLEKRSSNSVEVEELKLLQKSRKRNSLEKSLREGNPEDYAIFILYDSRGNDKKKNFSNDLTLDFIKDKLSIGKCFYCEDTESKLTLDRVDNNLGHLTTNVIVCCANCNIIRGNMPIDAWMHIVPSIKSARKLGLFNNWSPYNRRFG